MTERCPDYNEEIIPVNLLLEAYKQGFFPMAEGRHGPIYWHFPHRRAIIPLDNVKVHKSVKQTIRRDELTFKINSNFNEVIRKCSDREDCWINGSIIKSYENMHSCGYAHSIETYKSGRLVGGLYGVAIGGAFFGESMFSELTNASKAAFFFLCHHLISKGFVLLDSQYINSHTRLLGAIEISSSAYQKLLKRAIRLPVNFI